MFRMLMFLSVGVVVHGSGVLHDNIIGPAPIVTAASSQYFQRTFNRLVVPQPVIEAPIVAVTPVQPQVIAAQPFPINTPIAEFQPEVSPESNVAIAIATAHAAPVSTILLPPFPFAPNTIPLLPEFTPVSSKEETTEKAGVDKNTKEPVTSRPRAPEPIEPASNNNDLSQLPLETSTKVFDSYGMVPPKPQKLKTEVEIVPVPLAYIMPPPIKQQLIKNVRHRVVPSKIVIRPVKYVSAPLRIRYRVPKKLSAYRVSSQPRSFNPSLPQILPRIPINSIRDTEPTTFSPFLRPNTKPPRL